MKEEHNIKDIQTKIFDLNCLPTNLQPKAVELFNYPPETEWEKQFRLLVGEYL
jgi:hypothetical protein